MDRIAGGWLRRMNADLLPSTPRLSRIMWVFWPNKITNVRILQAIGQETIGTILRRRGWEWLGHVLRMEPIVHGRTALTLDSRGSRDKGASTNNMEENDTWRDEECWYFLGECGRISPRQGDLEEPYWGLMCPQWSTRMWMLKILALLLLLSDISLMTLHFPFKTTQ